MADEPAVPEGEAPPAPVETPPEPKADPPEQNLVGEAKRKQRQAEKEAADLRARLEELENRDKSETERERIARERAEKERDELSSKVNQLERGGWVRRAAAEAGFTDPDDAVAFADLTDIESEADAKRAVKSLATRKPHLLKPTEPPKPEIGRVLENGQPADRKNDGPTQAEQDAEVVATELRKIGIEIPSAR